MSDVSPIVRVVDLRKSFGVTEVLRGISFDVATGSVLTIIGASGSGKSTLLRCLNHLDPPTSGTVYLEGKPIGWRKNSERRLVPDSSAHLNQMRALLGMVFQQFNLWPHMTALGNVIEAPLRVKRLSRKEATELGQYYLSKVNLQDKADEYPARLSGGQQQRVAIARALAMQPKVMLFDEATSALDPELTGEVLEVIGALAKEGTTMLIVTHEMGFARDISDRVIFLHDGYIEEDGPPEKVFVNPSSERCGQFLSRVIR